MNTTPKILNRIRKWNLSKINLRLSLGQETTSKTAILSTENEVFKK